MKRLKFDSIHTGMHFAKPIFILSLLAVASVLPAQTTPLLAKSADNVALQDASRSTSTERESQLTPTADLPDAPGESSSAAAIAASGVSPFPASVAPIMVPPIAPLYHKYIEPGQTAQPLDSTDKVLFGFRQLVSPYLLLTVAAAAGYEQAVNGSPNYGTNLGAYGQRVGAAAIRDASQTIFSDSIMATVLHEDPRYYVMGNRRNGFVRATYAVSRVFVTRSDDGGATPNYSLFSGYAGAAALENAYYPNDNHGFTETAKSFGGSIGGAALSNVVREFLPDILHAAHIEK